MPTEERARKPNLEDRVTRAAEAALAVDGSVSVVDVFRGIGWLNTSLEQYWRRGRFAFLEEAIQANPAKVESAISVFRQWAVAKGLLPTEAQYSRASREGPVELRFTASGDPQREAIYRTHYLSPALPQRERQSLERKLVQEPKPVVFQTLRDSKCSKCGTGIHHGKFLFLDAGQPLCLSCAGMSNLEYLPAGDAAMTRRATKYSGHSAVVVRFSRSRKQYERQGILVEPEAIAKAERELGGAR